MDEAIAAYGDADVRDVSTLRGEEDEIARLELVEMYPTTDAVLVAHDAWHCEAVLASTYCTRPLQSKPRRSDPPDL